MYEFSRKYRLITKHDFQSVFAKPNKVSHQFLLALYQPNQQPHARLGIVLAKHHIKRAVHRNLLRRLIRESFRHHKEVLKRLDIIALLRSECTPLDKKTLRDSIDTLWAKLIA